MLGWGPRCTSHKCAQHRHHFTERVFNVHVLRHALSVLKRELSGVIFCCHFLCCCSIASCVCCSKKIHMCSSEDQAQLFRTAVTCTVGSEAGCCFETKSLTPSCMDDVDEFMIWSEQPEKDSKNNHTRNKTVAVNFPCSPAKLCKFFVRSTLQHSDWHVTISPLCSSSR